MGFVPDYLICALTFSQICEDRIRTKLRQSSVAISHYLKTTEKER